MCKQNGYDTTIVPAVMEHQGSQRFPQVSRCQPIHGKFNITDDAVYETQVNRRVYLVMQVRIRTEAPLPQLREQTDQPLHADHSFLKCSCRRARAGRPGDSAEGPQGESQD